MGVTRLTGTQIRDATVELADLSATGTPSSSTFLRGDNTWNAPSVGNLTGLGTGIATFLGTPSSANLAAAITDETGSGALVFGTSPVFTTSLGVNITPTVPLHVKGTATSAAVQFQIQNSSNLQPFTVQGNGNVNIGSTSNPADNSRLYVFGGANGANIDVRGLSGAFTDQAMIELEGNDYDSTVKSSYLMYRGSTATGNYIGTIPNADLGVLMFNGDNAIVGTGTCDLVFAPGFTEKGRWDTNGVLEVGPAIDHDTSSDGLRLINSQLSATTGRPHYSPRFVLEGSAANPDDSSINVIDFAVEMRTRDESGGAQGDLYWMHQIDGTGYGDVMSLTYSGDLSISGTFNAPFVVADLVGNAATATALLNTRTIGGVSFNGTANITVATATGGFTVSGGNLALGANSLTLTGSIGATAARSTKGWFTDLEITNMPTVGGTSLNSTFQPLDSDLTSLAGLNVAQGDLIYGSAASTYSKLAKNTTATRYLSNTGTSNNPAWAQIDLTNGVTGILTSVNGGTGNGFTKFSGPATSEKTFTLPNASSTLLYDAGPLGTPSSGTLTNATGLPIATGLSGLGAANRIPVSSSATALTTSANLTYISSQLYVGNAGASDLELRVDNGSNSLGSILTFATGNAIRGQISLANSDTNMVFRNASSVGGRTVYGFQFKNDTATVLSIDNNGKVGLISTLEFTGSTAFPGATTTTGRIYRSGTNGLVVYGSGSSQDLVLAAGNGASVAYIPPNTAAFGFFDAVNLIFDTTTGTKIGTATSQKLAFWNKTPIVQPTTGITGATFVAGAGTTVNDASTFGGYTLKQVVAALVNMGILA